MKAFEGGSLTNNYSTLDARERVEDRIVFWDSYDSGCNEISFNNETTINLKHESLKQ